MNKNDLNNDRLDYNNVIYGNTLSIEGIRPLKEEIIKRFNLDEIETNDVTYLSNVEQVNTIKKCLNICLKAISKLEQGIFIDMVEIDLKEILDLLGQITGSSYDEELLDTLFKNFCLGK